MHTGLGHAHHATLRDAAGMCTSVINRQAGRWCRGPPARWHHLLPLAHRGAVEPRDGPGDGQLGHRRGVLRDRGEVDVRQARQAAVVEPGHGHVARHRHARARRTSRTPVAQRSLNTVSAVGSRGSPVQQEPWAASAPSSSVSPPGTISALRPRPCRCSAPGSRGGARPPRGAAPVDVGDAPVPQLDEVVDGLVEPAASSVRTTSTARWRTARATTTTGSRAASPARYAVGACGPSRISASQRSCSRLATARCSSRPG